jgi:hypothetical protein
MTTTPATEPRQWEAVESEHETGAIVRYEISFGDFALTISRYDESQPWSVKSRLGHWILPATVTTPEEAIAEAVVAISQHLDWLREELAAIPLTLPTT